MMRAIPRTVVFGLVLQAVPLSAGPAQTTALMQRWEQSANAWITQMRGANTPEARNVALAARPDITPILRDMWREISPALDQPWTLEGAAWFLNAATGITAPGPDGAMKPVFASEMVAIRKAVESSHLRSPGLQPMCMALTTTPDPHTLSILEKIESGHPEPKTQGVAALGISLVLKSIGDSPEIMRKRLNALRKAIIDSADVPIGNTTVAKVAEDELYIIRYLTKGRVAPDLDGVDSAGRPIRLSAQPGKVLVLLFWSSTMPQADQVMDITRKLQQNFRDRGVTVVGVNLDPVATLRELEGRAENPVSWKSFADPDGKVAREYRVSATPVVYVLDANRKIHFAGLPGAFVDLTVEALLSEG